MPKISDILLSKFPYSPTAGQHRLIQLLGDFLEDNEVSRSCLLVKGYAGTGKTTLVSLLAEVLPLFNIKYMLMAPTGRAAKVISAYAGRPAYTIHKIIYKRKAGEQESDMAFKRSKNYQKETVFIVDEASMVSDKQSFDGQNLMSDLITFVYEGRGNKMIIIGDAAQLPPVGSSESPGLDADLLKLKYRLNVQEVELTEVVRQEAESGILQNATLLRQNVFSDKPEICFKTRSFKDIYRVTPEKMEDGIRYAFDKYGKENTAVLCRSNWQAVQYNMLIRRNILYYDEELEAGDILMVVKNNYFYLEPDSDAGFIANGDFIEVRKILDFEENYGFRFATLSVKLIDYPGIPAFEVKVMLDTLHSKSPALTPEEQKLLYQRILAENVQKDRKALKKELETNEYLNALQVKFAYALTCHKSQGGQWSIVFVDQGIRGDTEIDRDYLRWLYTAVTRATNELYLINFDNKYFAR